MLGCWVALRLNQPTNNVDCKSQNQSLNLVSSKIIELYALAKKEARQETQLNTNTFPQDNPFLLTEILDADFFPEN